jgi:hypothetical protein
VFIVDAQNIRTSLDLKANSTVSTIPCSQHAHLSAGFLSGRLAHRLTDSVESESYVTTTVGRPVCLGITHPSGACDEIFISARNTEYVWQLRSWFGGAPSLTRGRACLLYVPLARWVTYAIEFVQNGPQFSPCLKELIFLTRWRNWRKYCIFKATT